MSVRLSVHMSLKISVTIEPIEFYSSGNIATGPKYIFPHKFCEFAIYSRKFGTYLLFFGWEVIEVVMIPILTLFFLNFLLWLSP